MSFDRYTVFELPFAGSIVSTEVMSPSDCGYDKAAITVPSGDQTGANSGTVIEPVKIVFSPLPSAFAIRTKYLPGSGSLARKNTKRCPSGEKLGVESMSL